ncbi:MAG: SDR family oxidoreductase [Eubacterium sp.]|nr:SDR family oxidoreductase [Eubacterium sp.]MDD7209527.1 SDR family NAD(P)-dependent oxidoreductase [Lachnospiraceae bacterium]MDY5498412.1 SDR family NAD(P)-dependent oxidoreductase [Anaerobutyricum sp.]
MDRLKGKVAIVTGSTSGIGVGISRLFASEGAKVVVCGRREAKGQAVVDSIAKEGGEAWYHFMDMTQIESIEALIRDTAEKFGKIDILVNNAANVGLKDGRVDELTLEMWDNIFQSDVRGTFYAIKCVLPYMEKNENGGSIINIGSMASCSGDLGSTAYACAKAGVDKLTQYTALQYGKKNIRCNCVRPGLIVTPENEANVPQALKDIFMSNIMVNRYGCPEDIGHMCVYLASDESAYVTGQIVNVDGGLNSHVSTVAQFKELNSRTW